MASEESAVLDIARFCLHVDFFFRFPFHRVEFPNDSKDDSLCRVRTVDADGTGTGFLILVSSFPESREKKDAHFYCFFDYFGFRN